MTSIGDLLAKRSPKNANKIEDSSKSADNVTHLDVPRDFATEKQQVIDTFNKISPNKDQKTMKILEELKQRLETLEKIYSSPDEDPRKQNLPLPNDATLTYDYGARSYLSDVYPNYVWRNGHWYKKKDDLSFVPNLDKKTYMRSTMLYDEIYPRATEFKTDHISILDDSFYPVIIDGIRLFVKDRVNLAGYIIDHFVYFPHAQKIIMMRNFNQYANDSIVYEDECFMENIKEIQQSIRKK